MWEYDIIWLTTSSDNILCMSAGPITKNASQIYNGLQ